MIARFILAVVVLLASQAVPEASGWAQAQSAAQPQAWLGVAFGQGPRGVLIDEVIPDSPADIAGIFAGDIVEALGDIVTPTPNALVSAVQTHAVGDEVVVKLRRHGRVFEIRAELTTRLDKGELLRRRLVDKEAPGFSLPVVHGKAHGELGAYQDKVVVLLFWSSWCKRCASSIEALANLQADTTGDLVVLGITGDTEAHLRRFLGANSVPVPLLFDAEKHVHRLYRYESTVPTVVVIGRDGLVRYADTGDELEMDNLLLSAKRAVRERSL